MQLRAIMLHLQTAFYLICLSYVGTSLVFTNLLFTILFLISTFMIVYCFVHTFLCHSYPPLAYCIPHLLRCIHLHSSIHTSLLEFTTVRGATTIYSIADEKARPYSAHLLLVIVACHRSAYYAWQLTPFPSPLLSSSMNYDIFREELAIKYPDYGHALWKPSPAGRYTAVEIGDVGFIREGYFHRLFNILLPADHESHRDGVPQHHEPLVLRVSSPTNTDTLQPNNLRSYQVLDTSDEHRRLAAGPDDDAQFSFTCSRRRGAVLSLPVPAQAEDTAVRGAFAKFIVKHIDEWFGFARECDLGISRREDIILVTGRHLAKSWATIAFQESQREEQVSFGVRVTGHSNVQWQFTPEGARGVAFNLGPNGRNLPENQCIFIRGFRATRFSKIFPRLRGAAGPARLPDEDDPDPDAQLISIPDNINYQDPLHTLLEYIASQTPDCDVALVHDDDLRCIDAASLESLGPDVLMSNLQKSAPEIRQVEFAFTKVATLSNDIAVELGSMIEQNDRNVVEEKFTLNPSSSSHLPPKAGVVTTTGPQDAPKTPSPIIRKKRPRLIYSDQDASGSSVSEPSPNVQNDGKSMQTSLKGDTPEEDALPGLPMVQGAASVSHTASVQRFTPIRTLGDGAFGTVWLCDWHGPLPPNTPISAMQSVLDTQPKYANMRLVAVKRMKKMWKGSWEECRKLKELEALHAIPPHPNVIALYDSFILPETKELCLVFEPMEGNLYQLIKTRRSRRFFAGGLISSIFHQIVQGLYHIHAWGYFHRDMKPENILVTTTGLHSYPNWSPIASPNAAPERDVSVIIKLADFSLARETQSKPPYTEYVSVRWYRAPEVLLKSRYYSNPIDMWALGTIMAELVTLRPLFPGKDEADQLDLITQFLGDPCETYGPDARGKSIGGGRWDDGVQMARDNLGFTFQKIPPKDIYSLFDPSVPSRLIECIADLLKYDPSARLTSLSCLEQSYRIEAVDSIRSPTPALSMATSLSSLSTGLSTPISQSTSSFRLKEFAAFPPAEPDAVHYSVPHIASEPPSKFHETPSLSPRKQNVRKWPGLGGVFGNSDKGHLPPVAESQNPSQSQSNMPSIQGTQFSNTDSLLLPEAQSPSAAAPPPKDPKKGRKEWARTTREAEKQRAMIRRAQQREQARAVLQRRTQLMEESAVDPGLAWHWQPFPIESTPKARRRDFNDIRSTSSSDVHSISTMSMTSLSTMDSDFGPSLRTPSSVFSSLHETSSPSLLEHFDDVSISDASDQPVRYHITRAPMDSSSPSDSACAPPINALRLLPAGSSPASHQDGASADEGVQQSRSSPSTNPSRINELQRGGHEGGLSPNPGLSAPKSTINPIFKVPPLPSLESSSKRSPSSGLPPFSYLAAIADGEPPPHSPMSFSTPDDDS